MNLIFENKSSENIYFFLSPHLDDVVFSCGGLIAKVTAAGCLADVITFYTRQSDPALYPPNLLKQVKKLADYNTRQKEDIAALTLLKANWLHLDYIDRFFRPPWLTNIFKVFNTPKEPNLKGFNNLVSIKEYITKLVENNPKSKFFAPFGLGNHYDHVELFLASLMVAKEFNILDRFFFYEDIQGLGKRIREKHVIARKIKSKWLNSPSYHSITGIFLDFTISSNINSLNLFDYLPEEYQSLEWSVNTESIKKFKDKKLKAASSYKTQLRPIGGSKFFIRLMYLSNKLWGDSESYWIAN